MAKEISYSNNATNVAIITTTTGAGTTGGATAGAWLGFLIAGPVGAGVGFLLGGSVGTKTGYELGKNLTINDEV